MRQKLEDRGAAIRYCPPNGRKPTIHHSMEGTVWCTLRFMGGGLTNDCGVEDIAFHVALDHPETKTIVFMTGDRDFTYSSQILRQRGIRVEVLIEKPNGRVGWAKGSGEYWPGCLTPKTKGSVKGSKCSPEANGGASAKGKKRKNGKSKKK